MNTKRFKYYVIECTGDAEAYSIIAKTKRGAIEKLNNSFKENYLNDDRTGYIVHRIEIPYENQFDLFDFATGDGGGRSNTFYSRKEYFIKA